MLSASQPSRVLLVEHPDVPIGGVGAVIAELGQSLVRAGSPAEALAQVRSGEFALILAGLPDRAELLDLVSMLHACCGQVPLIVLAPCADPGFPFDACYQAGAIDVLAGPLSAPAFRAKARFFIDAAQAAAERRATEAALQEIRGRLDSTVAAAELAMWSWDIKRDQVTADASMIRLFDVSPQDAAGGPVSAYHSRMHPVDAARDKVLIRQAIETGQPFHSTIRVRGADGQYRTLSARGQVSYDSEDKPERLRGVVLDITGQRAAEAELRASEEGYRALFEAIDEGVCIIEMLFDAHGKAVDYRFLEMNSAFVQHTGLVGAVGKTVLEMVPGHDRHWFETYGRVAVTGEPIRFVNEAIAMNRWFDVYATRVGAADSRKVAVLFTDISERRRAEQQLRRLAADLAEADRRKSEFLATLAHELRNPLAPLRSGLQVLRLSGDNPAAAERVRDIMERQLGHMVKLIDDLLDVARINRGQVDLKRARVDLKEVLAAAVETALPAIEEHGHRLALEVAGQPLPLYADATRLTQVVSNLLNNAAKYTPPGGSLVLAARREQDEAVVTVADSGVGIEPADLQEVFEMFNQVGRDRQRAQGGLGIGLSLVRSLVTLHGGSVSAASAGANQGSTFTVRLPLDGAAAVADEAPPGAPREAPAPLRVLVVDDNRDAADTLSELLQLLGHATEVANDGPQALAAMPAFRPRVVFLDLGLLGMDGYEVAARIRRDDGIEQPLLVALTGWGGADDRLRTSAAGFDLHLTKPVSLAAIEQVLGTR